jgi:GDP-D-mannose dehydratase
MPDNIDGISDTGLKTPVAFLIFNRPDTTARVFEEIRRARPPKLLGLAKRVKARILQASTSEVYGDLEVHPQSESYWGRVTP